MSEKKVFSYNWGGRQLTVEIGQLAKQANGAVLVRYGDTVVLTAAVGTKQAKDTDFFPLTVNYEEKMYAAGKIPGGFIKREGRPSEHATLTARLIDRPIRPMFAEGFRNEVQITNTVMSVDPNCPPEMAAMFGSSLALCISDIPFDGPIAGVDVGRVNGEYVINPTTEQKENSDIELSVAGTATAINMVESSAKEVNEEDMLGALLFGHEEIKKLVAFQEEIVREVGKEKMEVTLLSFDPAIEAQVKDLFSQAMIHAIQTEEKLATEVGYWPIFRFDPRLAEKGKNPLQLDTRNPAWEKYEEFLLGERRYATLAAEFPEKAKELLETNLKNAKDNWNYYKRMAAMDYSIEE